MYRISSILFILTAIILISCGPSTPKRQFGVINSSNEKVTAYLLTNDSTFVEDFVMEPKSTAYYYGDTGTYAIRTRNMDGKKIYESAFQKVEDDKEGKSPYCWIDVTGESNYIIASAGFMYEGKNSLAEAIANTNSKGLAYLVQEQFSGEKFIESYRDGIHPYKELPKETGALSAVYVLVPIDKTLTDKDEIKVAVVKHLAGLN